MWCGDFNLELNSAGLRNVKNSSFKNVSSDFEHDDKTIGRVFMDLGLILTVSLAFRSTVPPYKHCVMTCFYRCTCT